MDRTRRILLCGKEEHIAMVLSIMEALITVSGIGVQASLDEDKEKIYMYNIDENTCVINIRPVW